MDRSGDDEAEAEEADVFLQAERDRVPSEADDQDGAGVEEDVLLAEMASLPLLPLRCSKRQWWDPQDSYDANFIRLVSPEEGRDGPAPLGPRAHPRPRTLQPSPFPVGAPTLMQAQSEQAGTRGAPSAPSAPSQTAVVSVLSAAALRAQYLERRRDLSVLHAALHGRPTLAADWAGVPGEPPALQAEPGGLGSGSSVRRAEACYREDEPAEDRPAPLQTVDVGMGTLGDYNVQVYSDGFVVHSKVPPFALTLTPTFTDR